MTSKINKSHLVLLKIIEKEGNKNCADCGIEGTRWASWNFGIFLCIRCAGIHRNLGVHISKVKSVDLDSWTGEQLQVMELMGNRKSQQIYEAALPENFIRPQTNYAIEEFIRSKYQYKRYCTSPSQSEMNSNSSDNDKSKSNVTKSKKPTSVEYEVDKTIIPNQESDDSLSDPDYLINLKEKPVTTYHKVHSEGDLINFNCNSKTAYKDDLLDMNKTKILSLYDKSNTNGGYQSRIAPISNSSYQKNYGSSIDGQYNSTTTIPASNQNSYLKQIQEKITTIKDNLTSKFKSYEQPGIPAYRSGNMLNSVNQIQSNSKINQNGGETLSPDLWR